MSSGEKGLILTFLLISHSICNGGVIMLDEPELHLNPAVCKTILPFLIDEYLTKNDVQAIICSHSPEILGSAFGGRRAQRMRADLEAERGGIGAHQLVNAVGGFTPKTPPRRNRVYRCSATVSG